jgi:hypothetical protein
MPPNHRNRVYLHACSTGSVLPICTVIFESYSLSSADLNSRLCRLFISASGSTARCLVLLSRSCNFGLPASDRTVAPPPSSITKEVIIITYFHSTYNSNHHHFLLGLIDPGLYPLPKISLPTFYLLASIILFIRWTSASIDFYLYFANSAFHIYSITLKWLHLVLLFVTLSTRPTKERNIEIFFR